MFHFLYHKIGILRFHFLCTLYQHMQPRAVFFRIHRRRLDYPRGVSCCSHCCNCNTDRNWCYLKYRNRCTDRGIAMLDCKDRKHFPRSPLSKIGSCQHYIDHVPMSALATIVAVQTKDLAHAGWVLVILLCRTCLVLFDATDLDKIDCRKVGRYDDVCSKYYLVRLKVIKNFLLKLRLLDTQWDQSVIFRTNKEHQNNHDSPRKTYENAMAEFSNSRNIFASNYLHSVIVMSPIFLATTGHYHNI